jgi:hypothetical protein
MAQMVADRRFTFRVAPEKQAIRPGHRFARGLVGFQVVLSFGKNI